MIIQHCRWSVSQTVEKEVRLPMWGQGRTEIVLSDIYKLKKQNFTLKPAQAHPHLLSKDGDLPTKQRPAARCWATTPNAASSHRSTKHQARLKPTFLATRPPLQSSLIIKSVNHFRENQTPVSANVRVITPWLFDLLWSQKGFDLSHKSSSCLA